MMQLAHFVDAMGDASSFWGKERVIHDLMHAQRASGLIVPRLIVFTESLLSTALRSEGFAVDVLESRHSRLPHRSLPALMTVMRGHPGLVVHSHSYKANVMARAASALGAPVAGLVSTCHGWFDETLQESIYNRADRITAPLSDITTACDPAMVAKIRSTSRVQFVRNAVRDREPVSTVERATARRLFGWRDDEFVVGMLGRLNMLKGALHFADAARLDSTATWAVAGGGPLEAEIRSRENERFRFVGYVDPSTQFLAGIDAYVQPSIIEGQSMSLLEAMRAGLPIVATRAGATEDAVRHEREALLVDVDDPCALAAAVATLSRRADLRVSLGAAARKRFEESFRISCQHEVYLSLYHRAIERRSAIGGRRRRLGVPSDA